jgi:hypothetical protein
MLHYGLQSVKLRNDSMHNSLTLSFRNSFQTVLHTNTFSGQACVSLWASRAQLSRLSPGSWFIQKSLWGNLGAFTQQAPVAYTTFPTPVHGKITPSEMYLSPQSTDPIKNHNEVYKGK